MRTCCREATAPRDTCYQLLHISCRRRHSAQVGIKGNTVRSLMGSSLENDNIPPWRRCGQYGSLGPERGRVEMRTWFRIFLFDFAPSWKQSAGRTPHLAGPNPSPSTQLVTLSQVRTEEISCSIETRAG